MAKLICLAHWYTGCGCPYGTADNPPSQSCLETEDEGRLNTEYCKDALPHNPSQCTFDPTDTEDALNGVDSGGDSVNLEECACVSLQDARCGFFDWLLAQQRAKERWYGLKRNQ
jgi:hypothetical protein